MDLQQQRIGQRRDSAQGSCSSAKRSGSSAKTARAAQDQRAFAAQRGVDAGAARGCGSTKRLGLVVALAQRQRPGRGEQQPRPPVELRRRAVAPASRAPRPGGRASSAIRTGCARRGRRRPRAGRRRARGARRPRAARAPASHSAARACSAACSLGRQRGEARAAARRARAHACAASRRPRRRRRPACRAPAAPAARRRRASRRRARTDRDAGGRGSRCASGRRRRRDRGWPAAGRRSGRAARRLRRRHRRDVAPAGRRRAAIDRQRELQAERPAFGQLVQARRGVAVDARAEALRAPARCVSSSRKRSSVGPTHDALAVGDQVVDARGRQSARAATTTRRFGGALRSR